MESGEHSSAAELVHNQRADSGNKKKPFPVLALFLRPLSFFSSFYFPQLVSTFLGHCPHFYYFGMAVGLFTVYMVMLEIHFPFQ